MDWRLQSPTLQSCLRRLAPVWCSLALALTFVSSAAAQFSGLGADAAQVAVSTGRVSVERAGELWAVAAGQVVQPGQVIVTGADGYAQLQMNDGSILEVFPSSRLIFRANRASWRDLLDIYLGKVRLHIQRLTGEDPPLRVTSPTAVISVRGTVFEVEVDAQDTVIFVETGSVSVRHRLLPGNEALIEAGETLRVAPSAPLAVVRETGPQLRALGRVVRAVGDTWAQISATRGGGTPTGGGPGPAPGGSAGPGNSGSNEPAPPPGGGSGEDEKNAPPGDVIP